MSKFPIVFTEFEGGQSSDIKQGPASSFYYSRHMDFRKNPTSLSVLPAMTKQSGLVVTGLVVDMIQLPSGAYVAIDTSGGVYQITSAGVWSKNNLTLPNTAYGMSYNQQQDTIWIPGTTNIHSITNADGRFGGTFTVNANAITAIQDQAVAGHTNSYTTTTVLNENATDKLSFLPTIEPLYSVKIWVNTKGTGDLVVTMHDAANNVLGTSTLVNALISAAAYNEFVFSTPVRMLVKPNAATYHFHVNHTGGTASTIGVSTTSDLSTGDYQTWSNRLISTTNGFHPTIDFLQYTLIGNGRYVVAWEPISQTAPSKSELSQHRLTFPSGYEVTSFALYNEYVVIGAEQRSTSTTNEYQQGKLFIWDGTSVSYNQVIDVPEGSPYGLFSQKNVVYYFANGKWWAWSGGNPSPIFQMPNTDFEYTSSNTYMVNYPHTIAVRNGILLGAFPSETNSTNIEHAVYSFGQRNKNYPNSFGYSYSTSTGSRTNTGSNNLRLGMLKSFGDKLFMSWRDDSQPAGSRFGVDKVDPNSVPYATATWESLANDMVFISMRRHFSRPDQDKETVYLRMTFVALPTGCTITPKIKINRASIGGTSGDGWFKGTAATAGATELQFDLHKRYREVQVGFDVTATTTSPLITSLILVTEQLSSEED